MTADASPAATAQPSEDAIAARLVRRIVRQWWLIAGFAVLAALVGYVASSSQQKQYEASSLIQVQSDDLVSLFLNDQSQSQFNDAQRRAATTAELINLPRVRERTARALGGKYTPSYLSDVIGVKTDPTSDIVTVTAKDPDPRRAQVLVDQTIQSFISSRRESTRMQLNQAKSKVRGQLSVLGVEGATTPTGLELQDRLRQVGVVGALANGGVSVVQTGRIPTSPVSPKPGRDAFIALFLGGLIGLGVAVLRARLDDRIRDVDELRELWPLPVVGLVPQSRGLPTNGRALPSPVVLESFSLARTNLRYLLVGTNIKSLVVTSALEGEGKSTVAWNLAMAVALAGGRVILIEGDLRRPVHSQRLGLTTKQGLSEVLAEIAPLSRTISRVELDYETSDAPVTVDVLPAGMTPPNPVALLELEATGQLLAMLETRYDVVIVDTPPATVVADALVWLEYADGALVVSRPGRVTRRALLRLSEQLEKVGRPILGLMVNGGIRSRAYGYSSYYTDTAQTVKGGKAAKAAKSGEKPKAGAGRS